MSSHTTPAFAVLWHYTGAGRDGWAVVYLTDDVDEATAQSLRPRPAMEPGESVVASLAELSRVLA